MTTLLSDPTFPSPDGFIDDGFHADLALASKPLICAINAGVEQRVFGLQPGPIRSDAQGGPDYVFVIGNDIPAAATAYDAGFMNFGFALRCGLRPNGARTYGALSRTWRGGPDMWLRAVGWNVEPGLFFKVRGQSNSGALAGC